MSINAIQFQHGLSLSQFYALYGTEAQSESTLVAARWPRGWQCARCALLKHKLMQTMHQRDEP